jgi:hypothetical protein
MQLSVFIATRLSVGKTDANKRRWHFQSDAHRRILTNTLPLTTINQRNIRSYSRLVWQSIANKERITNFFKREDC